MEEEDGGAVGVRERQCRWKTGKPFPDSGIKYMKLSKDWGKEELYRGIMTNKIK